MPGRVRVGGAGGSRAVPGSSPESTAADANTLAKRDANGRFKVADGSAAGDVVNKGQLDAAAGSAEATAATPDTLALRDANGRFKVADGSAAGDVVNKGQLDAAAGLAEGDLFPGAGVLDVTATRAFGTEYENTSGKAKLVVVTLSILEQGANRSATSLIGSASPPATQCAQFRVNSSTNMTLEGALVFIVPPGWFYRVNRSDATWVTLIDWFEYEVA